MTYRPGTPYGGKPDLRQVTVTCPGCTTRSLKVARAFAPWLWPADTATPPTRGPLFRPRRSRAYLSGVCRQSPTRPRLAIHILALRMASFREKASKYTHTAPAAVRTTEPHPWRWQGRRRPVIATARPGGCRLRGHGRARGGYRSCGDRYPGYQTKSKPRPGLCLGAGEDRGRAARRVPGTGLLWCWLMGGRWGSCAVSRRGRLLGRCGL